MPPKLNFIIGCTGTGKGGLGRELARRTGAEIISIDSMKVYRRMDIGTAKPSDEIRREIPHHLIDVVEPSAEFSVAEYVRRAESAISEIHLRGRLILVVGGTPLYVKALAEGVFEGPSADAELRARLHEAAVREGVSSLHGRLRRVDPVGAERIHRNDLRRIVRALEVFEITGRTISELQTQWDRARTKYECGFIGVRRSLEDQNRRTNLRVQRMIENGLVDEVASLLAEPKPLGRSARQALGYAEIIKHIEGGLDLAGAIEMIKINTRQFAKAQRTWFKRFRQTDWLDLAPESNAAEAADALLARKDLKWSAQPK